MDWDVFISHAWEDKEDIARPLAEALRQKGLRVWYDESTLTLGDSPRRSIDRGLAQSRYGVVILSPHFFAKQWTQKELAGLAAREVSGEKVILPVWHNITAEQVRKYSPTLADRVAVSSNRGLEHVVEELLRVIKPPFVLMLPTVLERAQPFEPSIELVLPDLVLKRIQSFEPEMSLIPAGEFLMGSDPNVDENATDREQPQHTLSLPDYYLARTPVTNSQYAAFVQDTGHKPPCHWEGDLYPEELHNHPVVNVSWSDAVAYCKWLSKKTGKPYRLPSEAEWEKAARGTDGWRFPSGDEWDVSKCNTREGGPGTTTPVGQYSPDGDSPYEVADMAGNIWEWCTDWLQPYPGNSSSDDGYGETHKVLRGSSWDTHGLAHCAFRYARRPGDISNDIGFRCAKALSQPSRPLIEEI